MLQRQESEIVKALKRNDGVAVFIAILLAVAVLSPIQSYATEIKYILYGNQIDISMDLLEPILMMSLQIIFIELSLQFIAWGRRKVWK